MIAGPVHLTKHRHRLLYCATRIIKVSLGQDAFRNKRRVTILVLVVIVVFAVCWMPIQIVLVLKALKMYSTKGPEDFSRIIFQIFAQFLAYLNRSDPFR